MPRLLCELAMLQFISVLTWQTQEIETASICSVWFHVSLCVHHSRLIGTMC